MKMESIEHVNQYKPLLETLTLQNFRGVSFLELALNPELTVFIGANGSGKTAILDAIYINTSALMKQLFGYKDNSIAGTDSVKNGSLLAKINASYSLEYEIVETYEVAKEESNVDDKKIEIELQNELYIGKVNFSIDINKLSGIMEPVATDTDYDIARIQAGWERESMRSNSPILKYYGSHSRIKNFGVLQDWIDRHQKVWGQNSDPLAKQQIGWLNDAVSVFLSEEVIYGDLRIVYSLDQEDSLTITKSNDPTPLQISQLSSGEKAMLDMVADLALSLIQHTPYYPEGSTPLQYGMGIVLIDEIDLHLHPSWQWKVLPKFRQIFPNIQFIVTTHSPLVIQHTEEGKVIKLQGGIAEDSHRGAGGWEITELLEYMGFNMDNLYAKWYQDALDLFQDAFIEGDATEAAAQLEKLKKYMPAGSGLLKEFIFQLKLLKK